MVKSIRTLPRAFILFQLNLCHTILYWGNQAESSFFPSLPLLLLFFFLFLILSAFHP